MSPKQRPLVVIIEEDRSLAAALALPARFPARDIIVFLAFCAIFGAYWFKNFEYLPREDAE